MWQRSYVAMSVLAGVPLDEALAGLPEGSESVLGKLPDRLRDPKRAVRATALAEVARDVALAVERAAMR